MRFVITKLFRHKKLTQLGFTVIELLVVISIIGLLSAIITVSLSSSRIKARDSRRLSDIRQIMIALELYYNDNYAYPDQDSPGGDPMSDSIGNYVFENDTNTPQVAGAMQEIDDNGTVLSSSSSVIAMVAPEPSPTEWQFYLQPWPTAPTPADGGCASGNATNVNTPTNQYTYWGRSANDGASVLDDPPFYRVTFCLGARAGDFQPGQYTATPKGIYKN